MNKLTKKQKEKVSWNIKFLYRCSGCNELVGNEHFIPRRHCDVPRITFT